MNMSFKYDKGDKKVIVSDQNGILTEMEYTDNIEELLIQKNIIESLDIDIRGLQSVEEILTTDLQNLEEKIKEQKINKKSVNKKSLIMFFIGTIGFTILFYLISEVKSLTTLLSLLATDSVLFGYISILYVKYNIKEEKEDLQERLNEQSSLLDEVQKKKEVLSKVLEREKEKYRELQEVLSKEKEVQMQNNNQITRVEHRERLEQIRTEIKEILGEKENSELDDANSLALYLTLKDIRKETRDYGA